MSDIQKLIIELQDKIKKQTDDLGKMENEAACLKSLITNDMNDLKKIVDMMESI